MSPPIPAALADAVTLENLTLEVTTRCGGSCPHCFVRPEIAGDLDMSIECAAGALREGAALGYRHLHLTGGDPFLWPPFGELVEEAAAAGYEGLYLNSTGLNLSGAALGLLTPWGTRACVSVSIEGPAERHDAMRGTGSRGRALSGAARALGAGIAATVFTSAGKGLVPSIATFARDIFDALPGLRELTLIQLVRAGGPAAYFDHEMLSPADFAFMARAAALLNLGGMPAVVLDNPLAHAAAVASGMPWLPRTGPLVRPGRVVVLVDGSIALAHSMREPRWPGGAGSITATLQSEAYARATAPDDATCPACVHRDACAASGMVRPSESFRDPDCGGLFCKRVLDICREEGRRP